MKKIALILIYIGLTTSCVYDDYTPIDAIAEGDNTNVGADNGNTGDDTGGNDNTGSTDPFAGKITYHGHVKFILNQQCVSCHGSVNPEDDLDISTYEKAKNKVTKIIKAIQAEGSDIMPPSGRMGEDLIQTIKDWGTDGLLEGDPNAGNNDSNTSGNYTYTADIAPLMTQECTACHGNTNPSGGLGLTTYALVSNNIDIIINRVDLQTGQIGIMPPAGRMAENKIQQIKDWKNQGLKE